MHLSRIGIIFAGAYLTLCIFFIGTQGLFGESFIALILGMPWSLIPAFFEFGNLPSPAIYLLVLVPLALNTLIMYTLGAGVSALKNRARHE